MDENYTISLHDEAMPVLQNGNYSLSANSSIKIEKNKGINEYSEEVQKTFVVSSEDFVINDSIIQSVFPPRGERGDYGNKLPFIVFKDRSFPWRCKPNFSKQEINPWFVLLVLPEDSGEVLIEGKLSVPQNVFMDNIPQYNDLKYLAHVRMTDIENKSTGEKNMTDVFSSMMGNRFIKPGINTAYLISIIGIEKIIEERSCKIDDMITVDCLYDWTFENVEEEKYGIVQFIENVTIDTLRPKENESTSEDPRNRGYIPVRHYMINGDKTISWYRGPFSPEIIEQEPFHSSGFAVERISYDKVLSMFDVSYSSAWQLGRLLALSDVKYASQLLKDNRKISNEKFNELKYTNNDYFDDMNIMIETLSDMIIQSPQNSGKMNYSFKAREKKVGLYESELKKSIENRKEKRREKSNEEYEYSELVKEKLSKWSAFYDVPFEWMFPDESLITDESVHLFMIDPNWHKALLDGAVSLGRYSEAEIALRAPHDERLINAAVLSGKEHRKNLLNKMRGMEPDVEYRFFSLDADTLKSKAKESEMSGILINSRVIADNPGLEIHLFDRLYDGKLLENELKIIRMERIKPSILLCIVEGKIKSAVFDMPSEGLNYGCNENSKISLRDLNSGIAITEEMDLIFHNETSAKKERFESLFDRGRIDFNACSENLEERLHGKITSAEIALEFTASRFRGVINFGKQLFNGTYETSDSKCE